jgi:hypothetical protein
MTANRTKARSWDQRFATVGAEDRDLFLKNVQPKRKFNAKIPRLLLLFQPRIVGRKYSGRTTIANTTEMILIRVTLSTLNSLLEGADLA